MPQTDPRAQPGRVSVLVHMNPALNARGPERAAVRAFATNKGGAVHYEYKTVLPDTLNLRGIPEGEVEALKRLPGVQRVEIDEYHPKVVELHDSTPLIGALQSQITAAGYSATGAGVRVCVVDTGIDTDHLMYADRIDASAGYDFYNNDSNPEDDYGHGSHVAGIAVGGTGLSWDPCGTGAIPFQGVAPEATLIGVKVLNQFGGGLDSDIIAGIDYCADQSPSGARADVINLSIGTGQYSGPCTHSWAVAANNAAANGVVVVAASGNENYSNALSSPACGADVIAVGMTWKADYPTCEDPTSTWAWGICTDISPQTDEVGCFSNESDYLDVTAPGANIWSASNAAGGASIVGKSGTSMASPQVAGLAALILSVDPSLTPAEVRQIIRDGALDLGPAGFDRAYGYGRIDVLGSLALVGGGGCSVPADCDDGLWCNGAEDCVGGSCVAGTPPDCDDGVACTDDSCNESTDACDQVANDAHCDDGESCTDDYCDAVLDCQFVPNDANSCDDGLFCNGAEFCSGGACQAGSDPCPGQSCDEGSDACVACDNNGVCDAGEDCNTCPNDCISGSGGATCGNGLCEAGDGEDCNNCPADCNGLQTGKPSGRFCCGATEGCGDSQCTSGGWTCTTDPQGAAFCCGDLVCEGSEDASNCAVDCVVCVVDGDCDDGNPCTIDSCDSALGCVYDEPPCQDNDGCCPTTCDNSNDNDCESCVPAGGYCTTGADCCSGSCHPAKNYCR